MPRGLRADGSGDAEEEVKGRDAAWQRGKEVAAMSHTWELREGKVLVVEDAKTASLVVVARDLKDRNDKVAVLEEILRKLQA